MNVVLILSDDQRWDTLWAMKEVQAGLVEEGVLFTNAFVTTPMCCPSRASLLSGGFRPAETGVLTNEQPNGGAGRFQDAQTLGTMFSTAGYATGFIGKYLNEYMLDEVPPGWSFFLGTGDIGDWYNYRLLLAAPHQAPEIIQPGIYLTDYEQDQMLAFIAEHENEPFFLHLSVPAPHYPTTPAVEDMAGFENFTPRDPSFNEANIQDKPSWVHALDRLNAQDIARLDEKARDQLRSLQAVDRLVGALLADLDARDLLDQTMIIFSSDNGFSWGEHRIVGKGSAHDAAIRVPLVIRAPNVTPREEQALVAANLDIGTTLARIAGVITGQGLDLQTLLMAPESPWRSYLPIEGFTSGVPLWTGVLSNDWKYVIYDTGEEELYDRHADPYELDSLRQPSTAQLLRRMISPGLTIVTPELPALTPGVAYSTQLKAWGGQQPLHWWLYSGNLPDCLTLSSDGLLSGTCDAPVSAQLQIAVVDAGMQASGGGPHRFIRRYVLGTEEIEVEAVDASSAQFWVPTLNAAHVRLEYSEDSSFDQPPARTAIVEAQGQQALHFTLEDLSPGTTWYVRAWRDGMAGPPFRVQTLPLGPDASVGAD